MVRPARATFVIAGFLAGTVRAHWVTTPDVSSLPLGGVDIVDAVRLRACGDGGRILASKDFGASWSTQLTGVDARLITIDFATPEVGWAGGVGGVVVGTTDAGQTWAKQAVIEDDYGLGPPDAVFRIAAVGADTAWALVKWGEVSVLRRTVGGSPWNDVVFTDHSYRAPNTLYDLALVSEAEGWLAASRLNESNHYVPVLMHTTTAGASWNAFDVPAAAFTSVVSPTWKALVSAPGPDLVWLHIANEAAESASLFRLQRGAGGWEWSVVTAPADVASLCFQSDARGFLVGARTWATRDAGATYRSTANPGFAPMTGADFLPSGAGAAVDGFGRAHVWLPERTGDLDGDGLVTLADAILLLRDTLAPGISLDPWSAEIADVDADGSVTLADAVGIISIAGGLAASSSGG